LSKIERLGKIKKTLLWENFMTRCHSILALIAFSAVFLSTTAHAVDRRARLGLGVSNQLDLGDTPSISFKLQTARTTSIGILAGFDSSDDGALGAGFKLSQNFFEEPQLVFYGAFMGAYLNDKRVGAPDESGFQMDFTLGSEFHLAGLKSLGFHFEFGVSLNKVDDFKIQTVGSQLLVMGIHFYL
jgi:hypothetical protein